jgi:hypothetical protein
MTAEERRKASGPLIGPRLRLRIEARQLLVRRSALRLPLLGNKDVLGKYRHGLPSVRGKLSWKADPDANRIAGMQFRVVIAGLPVVTRACVAV